MNIELKESDKLFEALNDLDFIEIVHDKPKEGDFQIKVKSKSWLEKKIGYNCIATYNHENNEITSHEKLEYYLDLEQMLTFLGIIKLSKKELE